MNFVNICGIGPGHCALHHIITACAAASLLNRRLKERTGKECRGEDGKMHVNKIKELRM